MKMYLASSWKNQEQRDVVVTLRKLGHEVYDFKEPHPYQSGFLWSDVDPNYQQWEPNDYLKHLNHPLSINGFTSDMEAMIWADCCVLLLPCGRSAHIEAGYFVGSNKLLYI